MCRITKAGLRLPRTEAAGGSGELQWCPVQESGDPDAFSNLQVDMGSKIDYN